MTAVMAPVRARLDRALGGPARRRLVVLLSLVLALDAADKATLGAVAAELQRSLDIGNVELGILASASLGVAGLATVPIGMLTDRVRRVPILIASIGLWSGALVVAGAAQSFEWLLFARLALGAFSATTGPTIASLTGDYFPPRERGAIYGFVLTGELIGAGFGFVVAGFLTAALSWRWGFWALVLPGLALGWILLRRLPEPARGGADRVRAGAEHMPGSREALEERQGEAGDDADADLTIAQQEAIEDEEVDPAAHAVLDEDPRGMPFPDAVSYVLGVRTNRVLIIGSALGWFFFAAARTFAVIFVRGHFGVGQSAATALLVLVGAGGLGGMLVGGRLSDALLRRGRLNARVVVAVVGYGLTPFLLAPAFASTTLWISMPLFIAGTATLAAANPPVDAGRLDVVHHRLWGRAEAVRTVARTWAEGGAPIVFGFVSQLLGPGQGGPFATEGAAATHAPAHATRGLEYAFLVMLIPVVVGALIGLRAVRSYPRDVKAAAESEKRSRE